MIETTPQAVLAPLTSAAIFLVAVVAPGAEPAAAVRAVAPELSSLVRGVGSRAPAGDLSLVIGFGAQIWPRLFGEPLPGDLHPFRDIHGRHDALATPGDILFHIRAARLDLCFELARTLATELGAAIRVVDEVHGFRYFDQRDLIGFVDGTENPVDEAAREAVLVGPEDPSFAGGSYVLVQKYLHDMVGWDALAVPEQERIIGRTKLENRELDEQTKPSFAHAALTVIEEDGVEVEILRRNMPFGDVATGTAGTYFISYARSPRPIEQMLENMFIGRPPGNYDRLLDFSRAATGGLFFAPSVTFLENLARPARSASAAGGSLGIGSLKGEKNRA